MLHVAGAETVLSGNMGQRQVRSSKAAQDRCLDGVEARGRQPATLGKPSGIAVGAEAEHGKVQHMLRDRVVGGGVVARESICRLDLMPEELCQFAAADGTRNLVRDVSANVGQQALWDSYAPTAAFGKLRQTCAPFGAHQRHLPGSKL